MLADAHSAWRELASAAGAGDLLRQNGCLYLYASKAAFASASSEIALRRTHGIVQELLVATEVAALEPNLPAFEGGGVFFPDAVNLTDPGVMMERLARAAEAAGVEFIRAGPSGSSAPGRMSVFRRRPSRSQPGPS